MHLYHGTLGPKKCTFEQFSHFGTRDAAIERIARRLLEGAYEEPIVMQVELLFNEEEILKLSEDWGSNQPIALARALKDHFENVDYEKHRIFEEIRTDLIRAKSSGKEFRENGWERIGKVLGDMRISAIQYPNQVEAVGSVSYCVIRSISPKCLNISKPTPEELTTAKEAVQRVMDNTL